VKKEVLGGKNYFCWQIAAKLFVAGTVFNHGKNQFCPSTTILQKLVLCKCTFIYHTVN